MLRDEETSQSPELVEVPTALGSITVIPAPIAYVNVVEIKTLVVESPASSARLPVKTGDEEMICFLEQAFTVNKIECSKQAIA